MLTFEDMAAHERLIELLPSMDAEAVKLAYRASRRDYERETYAGRDATEPLHRSMILARELEERALLVSADGEAPT